MGQQRDKEDRKKRSEDVKLREEERRKQRIDEMKRSTEAVQKATNAAMAVIQKMRVATASDNVDALRNRSSGATRAFYKAPPAGALPKAPLVGPPLKADMLPLAPIQPEFFKASSKAVIAKPAEAKQTLQQLGMSAPIEK